MPRMAGVSSSSTVWRMRRRPRPRTVALCGVSAPRRPLTCVTLIFLGEVISVSFDSADDLFDLLAALGRDLRGAVLLEQPVEGRAHDVVGVGGAVALGRDVG